MSYNNVLMTEILPYLYLGNRLDANNVSSLMKNGIGFILNLTTTATDYPAETAIISRHINILDSVYQSLKDTYQSAFDFIDEARKNNSKVLIHCEAGISRSPTITVAYLIYKNKMEALEAYDFVKRLRPIVSPNFGFMGQLMELENELVPEKVAYRMENEARLQTQAIQLQTNERLRIIADAKEQQRCLPTDRNQTRLQLSKPARTAMIKPNTLSLNLKKPTLPKPLSIDLPSPVLNAAKKYDVLPATVTSSSSVMKCTPDLSQTKLSNQNSKTDVSSTTCVSTTSQLPSQSRRQCEAISPQAIISSSSVCDALSSEVTKSSSIDSKDHLNTELHSTVHSIEESKPCNSNCQSDNQVDTRQSDESLIDSNNNISPTIDDVKSINREKDKEISNEKLSRDVIDKSTLDDQKSTTSSTEIDDYHKKAVNKQVDNEKCEITSTTIKSDLPTSSCSQSSSKSSITRAPLSISQSQLLLLSQPQSTSTANLPRSVPTSNACTPSNKLSSPICLSDLLSASNKSVSQTTLFITTTNGSLTNTKSQMKPLRPSTLFLNTNVPRKSSHNAITPSALCSPLTAFAVVSSTKSSPTLHAFPSNLSSPFEANEKLSKRRWLAETNRYQEFDQDFSPPECKKKNKQKKLKNISAVEVN